MENYKKIGYNALNQWFVDVLMKKQDKHHVDIVIGKLWIKFGKLNTTQSWRSSICAQVHALSQTCKQLFYYSLFTS